MIWIVLNSNPNFMYVNYLLKIKCYNFFDILVEWYMDFCFCLSCNLLFVQEFCFKGTAR